MKSTSPQLDGITSPFGESSTKRVESSADSGNPSRRINVENAAKRRPMTSVEQVSAVPALRHWKLPGKRSDLSSSTGSCTKPWHRKESWHSTRKLKRQKSCSTSKAAAGDAQRGRRLLLRLNEGRRFVPARTEPRPTSAVSNDGRHAIAKNRNWEIAPE